MRTATPPPSVPGARVPSDTDSTPGSARMRSAMAEARRRASSGARPAGKATWAPSRRSGSVAMPVGSARLASSARRQTAAHSIKAQASATCAPVNRLDQRARTLPCPTTPPARGRGDRTSHATRHSAPIATSSVTAAATTAAQPNTLPDRPRPIQGGNGSPSLARRRSSQMAAKRAPARASTVAAVQTSAASSSSARASRANEPPRAARVLSSPWRWATCASSR